jgi:hypothetical protein
MAFFDKKQDVIDVKLTQFGKNLLARGFFKPTFYRFFDDGVLYNPESANISETQKRSEERIQESQRLKTQHLVAGVETRYEENQNLINSGSLRTFMEIKRRQDPLLADKILKYPLESSRVDSQVAPRFSIDILESNISSSADTILVKGISLAVPQLNISSSYELVEDRLREQDIPEELVEYQSYMDLLSGRIEFLDKTILEVKEENLVINIEELNVDTINKNFEIEIFEVDSEGNLKRLETEEEVEQLFDIQVDEKVPESSTTSIRNERFRRNRD